MTATASKSTYPIPEDKNKQISPKFYDEAVEIVTNKLRVKFEEPHRRLKASIHRCQANAYSKQGQSLEQSEHEARNCFVPLLLVRRHASTMVHNARDDFDSCLSEANELKGKFGYDTARFKCLSTYKEDLKKQVPNLNQIYDGYQRNFQAHDGSLVNQNFAKSKEDKAMMKSVQETQKMI